VGLNSLKSPNLTNVYPNNNNNKNKKKKKKKKNKVKSKPLELRSRVKIRSYIGSNHVDVSTVSKLE
jgi:type II secretory pathway component HofQ